MDIQAQVLEAASTLVTAFAANDSDAYFAAFSADASFVFHTSEQTLSNRAAYRQLWDSWQRDGVRVLACRSLNPRVQVLGDNVALLCHDVITRLHLADQDVESHERETIVFRREHENAPWLACHEHLSAMPQPLPPT